MNKLSQTKLSMDKINKYKLNQHEKNMAKSNHGLNISCKFFNLICRIYLNIFLASKISFQANYQFKLYNNVKIIFSLSNHNY